MWPKKKEQSQNNSGSSRQNRDSHSCFSRSVIIQGDLISNDDMRIDGTVNGTINCSGKIVIGNNGVVTGDVLCSELEISGSLTGNLQIQELLLLHANSSYRGDALVSRIHIEPGADFSGTCAMLNQKSEIKTEQI